MVDSPKEIISPKLIDKSFQSQKINRRTLVSFSVRDGSSGVEYKITCTEPRFVFGPNKGEDLTKNVLEDMLVGSDCTLRLDRESMEFEWMDVSTGETNRAATHGKDLDYSPK